MLEDLQISEADIDAFLARYNASLSDDQKLFEFDEVRRNALISWNDLQACPGSGKTTLIASKLMILAKDWKQKHQGICVLTHTNVASGEIRSRLEIDADGYRLLYYPHFIGTIQEFVNRFLGLPYIKSHDLSASRIDDETCEQYMREITPQGALNYLERKRASLFNLKIDHLTGNFNIPGFNSVSTSPTYNQLKNVLLKRINKGLFFYSEMYYFANQSIQENGSLVQALRKRFPIVILDEMQDTQKFQDELINSIFKHDDVRLQRFGDPDQAIFDNMGGEQPNDTFNKNDDLNILAHSHRFSKDIASKVATISLSQIGTIDALTTPAPPFKHTIFIYNDQTKTGVLNAYAELVAGSDPEGQWKTVKAVGAVGHSDNHNHHIHSYWDGFDRRKQVKNPKPENLIDAVKREWWKTSNNSGFQYKLIVQSILDLMRIGGKLDTRIEPHKYFNQNTLKSWLIENNKYEDFRTLITQWIIGDVFTEDEWSLQSSNLKDLLELPDNNDVNTYIKFSIAVREGDEDQNISNITNIFSAENSRKIEIGTIHSVKGETHDATLVLETKFNQHDINQLMGHISGLDTSKITASRKSKFMRQLYVATSRPRHLLCLTIHEENISDPQTEALKALGWDINVLI